MMNCNVIRDLLPLYTDALTSPQTNQLIEEHIRNCPECGKVLTQLRRPIETAPPENTGYIKALRKQLQSRRIRTLCICLLVPVLVLLLWQIRVQTHFAAYSSDVDSTNPTFILKKEPRVELTRKETELAQILFSHPIIREAFPEEEPVQLPSTLSKDVLSTCMPEIADISEITLLDDYVIICYQHNGTSFVLEYSDSDHTGFVDLIRKTVSTPESNGKVKYVYTSTYHTATTDTKYERWISTRKWFDIPDR